MINLRTARSMLIAAGFAAFAGACAAPPAPDTRAQDEAAIRAAETEWSAAAAARDLEKSVSYYAADAVAMGPNEPKATGPAEIHKAWEGMLAVPGVKLTFQTGKVDVARDGDLAYSIGAYQMAMTGPDGAPMSDRGKYTTVWKKQADGGWKVVVDIFNSDLPAAPPPPPPPAKKGK